MGKDTRQPLAGAWRGRRGIHITRRTGRQRKGHEQSEVRGVHAHTSDMGWVRERR